MDSRFREVGNINSGDIIHHYYYYGSAALDSATANPKVLTLQFTAGVSPMWA